MDSELMILTLTAERDQLKAQCSRLQDLLNQCGGYPPGHYYSPVVDITNVFVLDSARNRLSAALPAEIMCDLDRLLEMMRRIAVHYRRFPFPRNEESKYRFYSDNPFFGIHDATVLFCLMMELKPSKVIEIGCGFSSRLLLDIREHFLGGELDLTLIDPSLNDIGDRLGVIIRGENTKLLAAPLQSVELPLFERLQANDILFIDSSHVFKTGSDVNYYLFQILPLLKPGVIIHVHDIFYPFEYLESWVVDEKRNWNEAYAIRAFLQCNKEFEIIYWNNLIYHKFGDELKRLMPRCLDNEGGSLWIRKRTYQGD